MTERTKQTRQSSKENDEIEFSRLVGVFIDNRWLIFGITSLCVFFGIVYALLATPIYRSDALIQVEQSAGSNILSSLSDVLPTGQPESSAETQLLQSRLVIGKTIDDLDLTTRLEYDHFPVIGKGISRIFGDSNKTAKESLSIARFTVPSELLNVSMKLKVVDNNHYILDVPDVGKFDGTKGKVLSADGIELLVNDIDAEPGQAFNMTKWTIQKTVANILSNLSVSDKGKDSGILQVSYDAESEKEANLVLSSITQNYLLQNIERKSEEADKSLQFLEKQLPAERASLDENEDKLNKFRQENDSVDLSLEAKSVLDTMVSVESQLNQLTFREAEISKLYTVQHPAYKALLEKRVILEKEKANLSKRVEQLPKVQQEILRLTRDVESGQAVYMQMLNKQQELRINKASTVGNVRIVDNPLIQDYPVAPKKILILAISLFIGIIFSVCAVIVKLLLHKGIESAEQLDEIGVNVYASVPFSDWQSRNVQKRAKNDNRPEGLLAINNPADLAIESIRGLRTSLHFAMLEAKNNVIMITGATPGIGKSFTSLNLAAVIAQQGKKVLVIDADMRKGHLHDAFGLTNKGTGLSAYLAGILDYDKVKSPTGIDNLTMIVRGSNPPNPSELLMGNRMTKLLEKAGAEFDLVIVDTPPVLVVTDAVIIGALAGTTLLVAKFETNTVKEVEICYQRFERVGVEVKGVIINGVMKRAANYYSYGSYAEYGYKYESDK